MLAAWDRQPAIEYGVRVDVVSLCVSIDTVEGATGQAAGGGCLYVMIVRNKSQREEKQRALRSARVVVQALGPSVSVGETLLACCVSSGRASWSRSVLDGRS